MPKTHPQARRAALAAVAGFALIATAPVAAHAADPLVPDPALASCINAMIDATRPADQEILPEELARLTELHCGMAAHGTIRSLAGLEHASSLVRIFGLGSADLSAEGSLMPLAGLTKLKYLIAEGAGLTTLAGLEGATSLFSLGLAGNNLTHVDELAGLRKLSSLSLAGNTNLADISGLTNVNSLVDINLQDAHALNGRLAPLAGKPGLRIVNLNHTNSSSLEVFADNHEIQTFQAIGNQIASLRGLTPVGTVKVTSQSVAGPVQYVAAGANTHRANLAGIVSMFDGETSPVEIGKPLGSAPQPQPEPASPWFRFSLDPAATEIAWTFEEGGVGTPWFQGTVTQPIERVVVRSDFPEFTVGAPGTGANTLQTPEGEPSKFPVTAWALGDDAPSFLHIDPVTGVVSGTPTEPGTYPFTVIATDELGNPVAGEVTLTVGEDTTPPVQPPGPPVTETPEPPVTKPPTTAPTAPPLVSTGDTNSPTVLWGLGGALGLAGVAALALALPRRRRR